MIKKIVCIPLFFCLNTASVLAQQKQVVPTTPTAANLSKFVNYPVDYNTGVPNISVPLHEITAGELKLPISLFYHAGGFKINEKSTNVGLGWTLSTDLQITRAVNGTDDFGSGGYFYNAGITAYLPNQSNSAYNFTTLNLYNMATGVTDGMPDKFNYKLLDKAGSFYFMKGLTTGYTIVPVPFENIKIEFSGGDGDGGTFIITDTDGTQYTFADREITNGHAPVVTAWKCSAIVNANYTDGIDFTYQTTSPIQTTSSRDEVLLYNNPNPGSIVNSSGISTPFVKATESPISAMSTVSGLNSSGVSFYRLATPKAQININGGSTRYFTMYYPNTSKTFTDVGAGNNIISTSSGLALARITFRGGYVVFTGKDQLSSIEIFNSFSQSVKKINLYQSFTPAQDTTAAKTYNGANFPGTSYLDSIQITGTNGLPEKTGFRYRVKFCFGSHLKGSDAWGYLNGSTTTLNNSSLTGMSVPSRTISQLFYNSFYSGSDTTRFSYSIGGNGSETPDELLDQYGVLNRIIYPTGGYTDFNYETNRYIDDVMSGRALLCGGLRIKTISYNDGNSLKPVKQQYFTYGAYEAGAGIELQAPKTKMINNSVTYGYYSYDQNVYYVGRQQDTTGGIQCYDRSCLRMFTKEVKTTYLSNSALDFCYGSGAPIFYPQVAIYESDYGIKTGKKIYNYDVSSYGYYPYDNIFTNTNVPRLQTEWQMGALLAESDYKFENNAYSLLHRKRYTYTKYQVAAQVKVLYSFMRNLYVQAGGSFAGTPDKYYTGTGINFPNEDDFLYTEYGLPIGKLLPLTEEENWFNGADSLKTLSTYTYSGGYLQPTSITTVNSDGVTKVDSLKYAYNFTDSVYRTMVNINIIDPVIERKTMANGKEIKRERNNYAFYNNLIEPSSIQQSYNGVALSNLATFDNYDVYGNLGQSTSRSGIVKSYLWGYNYLYPVMEATGITYNTAASRVNNSTLQYPAQEADVHTEIAKVRVIANHGQQVKGYAYKPLVGTTSTVDENGHKASYAYDGLGRLLYINDNDGYIVKKFSYFYKNPGTNANTFYFSSSPLWQSLRKMGCTPATDGSLYQYVLAGGTNTGSSASIAESSSTSQAASAAQTAANTYGVCAPSPNNVQISFRTYMFMTAPSQLYVDLLQKGIVIASVKLPGSDADSTTINIPQGSYQMSVRIPANYYGFPLTYWLETPNVTSVKVINTTTFNITTGRTYMMQIHNDI